MRRLLPLLALLPACSGPALGDPDTVLQRMQELQAEGEIEDVADLGKRAVASPEVPSEDRAEASFLAGEAEHAQGRYGAAFERYRWILENAPWSEHVVALEDRLFEMGRIMLFGEGYSGWFDDRARGVEVMETLAAHFRASPRADDALRMVGDYFASDDVQAWGEASLAYLRVFEEYPDSEWAERSLWLAGRCRLQEARGPAYDRNELLRAAALLQRSLTAHPRGVAVQDTRSDLAGCREQLAQAELVVADFYAGRGVPAGEVVRLANAASLYPDTQAGQVAAARLVALGLDPAAVAQDPRRNSIEKVKFVAPRWEREAEERRKAEPKYGKKP